MTRFFKLHIISDLETHPNKIKHSNMSTRLPSCNQNQILDLGVIYTPFLRSKIKNVWKILHDFRVSQFNCSLWTSPQSHTFNRIEFFQHLLQEDITLKKYRCVLHVACKSSVPNGRFDNMISTRNVQVMDILCEAEGVPKA